MSAFLTELLAGPQWKWASAGSFLYNAGMTHVAGRPRPDGDHMPLGGLLGKVDDNAQVSNTYPTLVSPAKYAFSIWFPIFALEAGLTAWQVSSPASLVAVPVFKLVNKYWVAANVLQGTWAIAFGKHFTAVSALILTGITYSLSEVHSVVHRAPLPMPWLTQWPISVHFGWTVAAALVNWNIALKQRRVSPAIQTAAAWATILGAFAASTALAVQRADPAIAATGAWALIAIGGNEKKPLDIGVTPETKERFTMVARSLGVVSLVVTGAVALGWLRPSAEAPLL